MKINGEIKQIGKFWSIKIPLLLINTQGTTRKDALEMAKDAVEGLVDVEGFEAMVEEINSESFTISSNDKRSLFACILKQNKITRVSEEIIKSLLDRGVYNSQSEAIDAALVLLLEKQIEKESAYWDEQSQIDEGMVKLQLRDNDNSND